MARRIFYHGPRNGDINDHRLWKRARHRTISPPDRLVSVFFVSLCRCRLSSCQKINHNDTHGTEDFGRVPLASPVLCLPSPCCRLASASWNVLDSPKQQFAERLVDHGLPDGVLDR